MAAHRRLAPAERAALEALAARFRREKHFAGCAGFRVTERVRWTVAGWRTVLVYPAGYRARSARHAGAGVVAEGVEDRAGEATRDVVVLSWSDAGDDGGRLILHETAHQVDFHFGLTEHLLERTAKDLTPWQRALRREYSAFVKALNDGKRSPIDRYAAEDPAEFFAVSTEDFFTTPKRLAARLPRVHALLNDVYRSDPLRARSR